MPGGDRTGPRGYGPATGWGRGPCGRGFRRIWSRFGPWSSRNDIPRDEERNILKSEMEALEEEKREIKRRLDKLENE